MAAPAAAIDEGVVMYWSGGKDCALALHLLHRPDEVPGGWLEAVANRNLP